MINLFLISFSQLPDPAFRRVIIGYFAIGFRFCVSRYNRLVCSF